MLKPCIERMPDGRGCPNLTDQSRCAKHRRPANASWSKGRDHAAHKRFARAVKARDGGCVVCGATTNLRAHHIRSLAKGGSDHLSNGVTLCKTHDKMADRYAR